MQKVRGSGRRTRNVDGLDDHYFNDIHRFALSSGHLFAHVQLLVYTLQYS